MAMFFVCFWIFQLSWFGARVRDRVRKSRKSCYNVFNVLILVPYCFCIWICYTAVNTVSRDCLTEKLYQQDAFMHVVPRTNLFTFYLISLWNHIMSRDKVKFGDMKFHSLFHISKKQLHKSIHIAVQYKDERRWINNLLSVFQRADSAMLMYSFVSVKSDCFTIHFWTCLTGEKICLGSHLPFSLSFLSLFLFPTSLTYPLQSFFF